MSSQRALMNSLAVIGLVAGLAAWPQPARASNDGLPDGSWRQSCEQAYVRDGALFALCRRDGGKSSEYTSVAIGSCQAFGNRNGSLYCESQGSSGAGGGSAGQWSGSFLDTCRNASVDRQGKLQATCRKDNGTYKRTNLQAHKCPSHRAGNQNGNLICEPASASSGNAGRWHGSFLSSCRDIDTDASGTLRATCQAANGASRRTSLAARQCPSYRAGNRDGTLFCESKGSTALNANRWEGSFQTSCRDVSVDANGVLSASCQAMNGSWNGTSLSPRQCSSYRAGNQNGNLVCESDASSSSNLNRWDGSFEKSCREVSVDANGVLTASCQAMNGGWNRSSLSPRQCSSYRAGNQNGNLVCESDASSGSNLNRWEGSFQKSCRDVSMDSAGTLTATCQTMNGNWNRSSLSTRQCNGYRAGNRDGTLVCESDGSTSSNLNRWDGSFQKSCREVSVDANGVLTASCQAMNGGWNRTSLSPRQCGSYLAGNQNGNLVCER